ncbi:heavy metal sensor histidine kinase [Achromobacter sp. MY14]|uniref:heavy metal sensor histidine kinase n=1 Tax=Achromobacter TaxID=222 RepID=UPI001468E72F|nr:heavy metal sensor histidine kinase [Achromobacter mucicolens]MCD0498080.1 heavy metal sensor histidine kinase [Achromobacter sp. MY14]MCP2518632.1 heavy metal sensor histidine kinase [Achromobacter mucicolens]CAB3829802.1 Sensor histidine kinase CusS [Achromobacter mucicolens]
MRGWRIPSIEIRLTVLLGVIAFVVSCIAGYTLFWALKREVQRQEMSEVAGKLELIDHLIDMLDTPQDMEQFRETLGNILVGHVNLRVWILGRDGKVLYGTDAPPALRQVGEDEVWLKTLDGWDMRGLSLKIDSPVLKDADLIVAVNIRPSMQFLYAFATALIFICALWVGATVVLSAWAVRRSLTPIRRLSVQASLIQPENLAVRLPERGIDRELREFTHTFNNTLDRLQAAYQQMEGFNADVAHELRTPLATLINGTEVTLSSAHSVDELKDLLASNLEELQSLTALVNDMLFLARADGGELAQDPQQVQLLDVATHVVEYYEAALEEAGLSVTIHGGGAVRANPRLLRRALANLLSNAIKASPRGLNIDIFCRGSGSEGEIKVRNMGTPIEPEALPRIFDRFFRADSARSGRAEGHGLGLAIVDAIARMHGGTAFAASNRGGTEVGISIGHTANITKK